MLSRDKLLHPATVIALVALFVSLGGASYAAVTIGTGQIRNGAVTGAKLSKGSVSGTKLRNGAVTNAKIGRGAIGASKFARGAVGAAALAGRAVGSSAIAPGAVGATALANGNVGTAKLADRAVTSTRLGDGSVTSGQLLDGAVTNSKLGSGSVTSSKLGSASVGTNSLADSAVTTGKLADTAVTTAKIADGSVSTARLAPGAAVSGVGSVFHTSLTLTSGQSGVILQQVPSLGTLVASCAAGVTTTQWNNDTSGTIGIEYAGVNAPGTAFADHFNPPSGGMVPANPSAGGSQSLTWQVNAGDGAAAHVATVEVSDSVAGTSCVVVVQSISS